MRDPGVFSAGFPLLDQYLFRLAACLTRQGRRYKAHQAFQRTFAVGNELVLFAEKYDPAADKMLGNFPQSLTHLSLISVPVRLCGIGVPAGFAS